MNEEEGGAVFIIAAAMAIVHPSGDFSGMSRWAKGQQGRVGRVMLLS